MDYQFADKIVSATYLNIEGSSQDNGIYLTKFDLNKVGHLYFFEVATIVSDMRQRPIYIESSFLDYIKICIRNKKRRIRRIRRKTIKPNIKTTKVDFYLQYMSKAFDIKLDFFDEIYKEYYMR